jgi:hypothetical protein
MRIHFCQISLSVALLFSFVFFEQRLSEIGTLSRIGLLDITDQPEDVAKTGNFRSEQTKSSPNVLYTVFAGRKDRLLLQEPYWRELKRIGAIDEVHLWNYTDVPRDLEYIRHVEKKYSSFLKIMEPSSVPLPETLFFDHNNSLSYAKETFGRGRARLDWPGRRIYTEYYKYYSDNPYDGVIIKADDDIVWINSTQVRPFADYIWNHKEIFLLSASVVNQGLCAHYQQLYGAIPPDLIEFPIPGNGMGELHNNSTQALMLHRYFLESQENRQKFFITDPVFIPFDFTINVNFVAIRGQDFPQTFDLIVEKLKKEKRYYDEGAITYNAILKGYKEGIYMPLVVSHATYGVQLDVARQVLTAYHDYAKEERSDFYGMILDEWEPPPETKES